MLPRQVRGYRSLLATPTCGVVAQVIGIERALAGQTLVDDGGRRFLCTRPRVCDVSRLTAQTLAEWVPIRLPWCIGALDLGADRRAGHLLRALGPAAQRGRTPGNGEGAE